MAGGNAVSRLEIVIGADTSQGEAALARMGVQVEKTVAKTNAASKSGGAGFRDMAGGIRELVPAWGSFAGAVTGASVAVGIAAATRAMIDLGVEGARIEELGEGYAMMAAEVGVAGDAIVAAMDKAARRTIDDQQLMLMANQAWTSGLRFSADQFGQLVEVSRVRAKMLGTDTASAYNEAIAAITAGSSRGLKRLGVGDFDQTLDKYAASLGTTADKLSDAQIQLAAYNALIATNSGLVKTNADAQLSNADKIRQLEVAFDGTKDAVAEFLAPFVGGAAERVATGLNGITKATDNFSAAWAHLASLPLPEAIALLYRGGMPKFEVGGGGGGRRGADMTNYAYGGRVQAPDYWGGGYMPSKYGGTSAPLDFNDPLARWGEKGSYKDSGRVYEKIALAGEEGAKELNKVATAAGRVNDAFSTFQSSILGIMTPTSVTEMDMLGAQLGKPHNAWDEPRRRLQDVANRGTESPWAAHYGIGGTNDEAKYAAMQRIQAFDNYDYSSLPPEEQAAMKDAIKQQYKEQIDTQRRQKAFIAGLAGEMGWSSEETAGLTQGGALGTQMADGFTASMAEADFLTPALDSVNAAIKGKAKEIAEAGEAFMDGFISGARGSASGFADVLVDILLPRLRAALVADAYNSGGGLGGGAIP